MRPVAAGRLAVASDPVAGERQHERGQTERAEGGRVDEEPCEEAADGTCDAPAEQGERHERDEQDVGHGPEDVDLGEDRDLNDRRDEEQGGGLDAVAEAHRCCFLGTSAETASSEPRFAKGCTCTCRNAAVSVALTVETVPIGMPYG